MQLIVPTPQAIIQPGFSSQVKQWAYEQTDSVLLDDYKRKMVAIAKYFKEKKQREEAEKAARYIEIRIAQLLPPADDCVGGRPSIHKPSVTTESLQNTDLSKDEKYEFRKLADNKQFVENLIEKDGITSRSQILKYIDRAKMAEKAIEIKPSDNWKIHHSDLSSWNTDKLFDWIITDPPYPKNFLFLYEILAEKASIWLKDGGLLVVMCGQSYLPEIYKMLSKYLNYYWTAAYLTPGQPTPLRQVQVNTTWKPLLIFSKGKYNGKIFGDVFKSDGNDKDHHKWGQSISGMVDIVSKLTLPGESILDPFCGAGTTGIAALRNGCFFDGIEIDEQNVKISQSRLSQEI